MQNPFESIQKTILEVKKLQLQLIARLNDNRPDYYTIEEAAEIIGCDTQTIHRHIKKGTIKAKNWGNRLKRIPKEELFENSGDVISLKYKR